MARASPRRRRRPLSALCIALLPIAALFSCLCLGLAAMARSTKEGQYYLMPLLLVTTPLVILPMSPGVQLNLGNSLVPVTGVVLLLRSMLDGEYWQALQFAPIVAAVTLVTCLISARWAVDQFHSESVLFREGERMDCAAVAAAPAGRAAAHAHRRRGAGLRRAHPGDSFCAELLGDRAGRLELAGPRRSD